MKISYYSQVDAMYIRLIKVKRQCRTLQLNEKVLLDIGENEVFVGIEILDAKNILGEGKLPEAIVQNLAFKIER